MSDADGAAIVEATLRVIGARGADAVTHRAVAAEAGVPLASTTYYFASKEALVREAFELTIERSLALVDEHAARTRGHARSTGWWRWPTRSCADADAPLAAQFELMLEAGRRPELRDLAARWDERYRDGPRPPLVGDELDVEVALCLIDGALIGQLSFPVDRLRGGLAAPDAGARRARRVTGARSRQARRRSWSAGTESERAQRCRADRHARAASWPIRGRLRAAAARNAATRAAVGFGARPLIRPWRRRDAAPY